MKPAHRRILHFVLQFLPLFAACLWIYVEILPRYERALIGAANAVTERLTPPTHIEFEQDGQWQSYVFTAEAGRRPLLLSPRSVAYLITLSLAMLPAMLLATPAPWLARMRLVGMGLVLLFAVHVLCVIGLMRWTWCLQERPGAFLCLWMLRMVYTSGQVLGAVLWALLTWRYWLKATASGGGSGEM